MTDTSKNTREIEKKLNYQFKDKALLELAFIHRSYINEHPEVKEHNERLEFLGDSVLGLIVAEYLYDRFPDWPEGELSHIKSRLVEASACTNYVEKLHVESYLLLGRGERLNPGRGRFTILADLLEAIIAAIFLDGGFSSAKQFFFSHFQDEISEILKTPPHNWKALLQDFCQKTYGKTPTYDVLEESGPDHRKMFKIAAVVDGNVQGVGEGNSKKEAQQTAAKEALSALKPDLFQNDG